MYGIINKTNVQNVKNTMVDQLLSLLAPHPCYSCGQLGSILCDNCKYNINSEHFNVCILCGCVCKSQGICGSCNPPFSRAICIGERADELRCLIDAYKFQNVRAVHTVLAKLLSMKLGTLPSQITIVPVPTVSSHIRKRGYDHTLLIAKKLARLQNVSIQPRLLRRTTNTQQRGASKKERKRQAKVAFIAKSIKDGGVYLLIDDVVTTGATLQYSAKALLDAGADDVWVAVVARQPLD